MERRRGIEDTAGEAVMRDAGRVGGCDTDGEIGLYEEKER